MRLYFNLDENKTIRFQDLDASRETANTWSCAQDCGEDAQIKELAGDIVAAGFDADDGYMFSSDLDFATEYGFADDEDAHSIVAQVLTLAAEYENRMVAI